MTLDHGLQPFAVVDVGRRDADEEGQSVRVRQDANLGARPAPVHGARTCVFAPYLALTCAVSRTTRVTDPSVGGRLRYARSTVAEPTRRTR